MRRDPSVELFRVLCMMGVCFLHALDQGGFASAHRGLDNLMCPCVVGFIFISGYFGVRLKVVNILKLVGIGITCVFLTTALAFIIEKGKVELSYLCTKAIIQFRYSWFLWGYLALMFLAPVLETFFDKRRSVREFFVQLIPCLFLVFVWSYASTNIPIAKNYTPPVDGFSRTGVLTFVGIYMVSRTCRYYSIENIVPLWGFVVTSVVSGLFCWIGFMHYNSPFALLFAGSIFYVVKHIHVSDTMASVVMWLGPSMFSVYLIHTNDVGFTLLRRAETYLIGNQGWNYYVACASVAIVIFISCVILDMPRRGIALCMGKLIRSK